MKTVSLPSLFALLAAATGCNPAGYVKARDTQDAFRVADAIFVPVIASGQIVAGDLLIGDQPNLCETVRSGQMPGRLKALMLRLVRVSQTGYLAPDVGRYTVMGSRPTVAGSYAFAERLESDLNCKQTLAAPDASLNSGWVELKQLDATDRGAVVGKFEVSFYDPALGGVLLNQLEGGFSAEYCRTPAAQFSCR